MPVTLNGTTGITTPADTVTGNATVGGTLNVTGATTLGAATLGATTATSLSVAGTAAVAVAPSTTGNVLFTVDGSTWSSTQKITQGTSVSASGTSVDFTSIPSWAKRITVMLAGVTTPAGAVATIRIGSGGTPVSSGYVGANSGTSNSGTAVIALSTGFTLIDTGTAAAICALSGLITLDRITGNTWAASSVMGANSTTFSTLGGYVALGAALDIVRLTTTAGSASFTAGTVNIFYE